MQFIPYLNFNGDCAQAFAFYRDLFGGQIVYQGSYGEMPDAPPMSEQDKKAVMHVHLQVGEQALMGSDAMPGAADACAGGYQRPQGLWVSLSAASIEEGRRVFDALAAGGSVAMPFAATFWSPGFGMVSDRYGTPWMVNVASA